MKKAESIKETIKILKHDMRLSLCQDELRFYTSKINQLSRKLKSIEKIEKRKEVKYHD